MDDPLMPPLCLKEIPQARKLLDSISQLALNADHRVESVTMGPIASLPAIEAELPFAEQRGLIGEYNGVRWYLDESLAIGTLVISLAPNKDIS